MDIDQIQQLVNGCGKGGLVHFGPGKYKSTTTHLLISKGMTIIGSCIRSVTGIKTETELPFKIIVNPSNKDRSKLLIRNISIIGKEGIEIKDNHLSRLELKEIKIRAEKDSDAVIIHNCMGGAILLNWCEIYGGSDGISNTGMNTQLHIKDCEIRFAKYRGILSNNNFTIEDSEVSNCGSYGIKDRGGHTSIGDNDIQAGPWG
jgi:hypothetical protein